jgi:hypothetical protein
MRALVIALLAMMHLAGVAWSGETIVSGDSDHDYLPRNEQQEVLLHRFSYLASISNPATYIAWSTSYNANCLQMYNANPSVAMEPSPRACTGADNAFRAPRKFRLTRVVYKKGARGIYEGNSWAEGAGRIVIVATDGTITTVGADQAVANGAGATTKWDLATDVSAGVGVGIQFRGYQSLFVEDIVSTDGHRVELWGIWK